MLLFSEPLHPSLCCFLVIGPDFAHILSEQSSRLEFFQARGLLTLPLPRGLLEPRGPLMVAVTVLCGLVSLALGALAALALAGIIAGALATSKANDSVLTAMGTALLSPFTPVIPFLAVFPVAALLVAHAARCLRGPGRSGLAAVAMYYGRFF
jgi:hypothetical protein